MRAYTLKPTPQHTPLRAPRIRRAPLINTPVNPVDKTAQWLNRTVIAGFLSVGLYLTGHFAYALIDNTVRLTNLSSQQTQWTRLKTEKAKEHTQLTMALQHAQSPNGLEALVRNKLGWVEDKEVLVRIH